MPNTVRDVRALAIQAASRQLELNGTLSMRTLGATIGVSAPALYHHFASRQHLLDAVADHAFAEFEHRLRSVREHAAGPERRDPRDIIQAVLGEYRQFAGDHPNLFGLMFVEPRPSARRFPRDFAAHRSAVFNTLWKAVELCASPQADGADGADDRNRDDALFLAHDLWALAHGLILLWRAGRFETDRAFEQTFNRSIDRFVSTLYGSSRQPGIPRQGDSPS